MLESAAKLLRLLRDSLASIRLLGSSVAVPGLLALGVEKVEQAAWATHLAWMAWMAWVSLKGRQHSLNGLHGQHSRRRQHRHQAHVAQAGPGSECLVGLDRHVRHYSKRFDWWVKCDGVKWMGSATCGAT